MHWDAGNLSAVIRVIRGENLGLAGLWRDREAGLHPGRFRVTFGCGCRDVNGAVKSTHALALLEPNLDCDAPEPKQAAATPRLEDIVARAQQSVGLILVC